MEDVKDEMLYTANDFYKTFGELATFVMLVYNPIPPDTKKQVIGLCILTDAPGEKVITQLIRHTVNENPKQYRLDNLKCILIGTSGYCQDSRLRVSKDIMYFESYSPSHQQMWVHLIDNELKQIDEHPYMDTNKPPEGFSMDGQGILKGVWESLHRNVDKHKYN